MMRAIAALGSTVVALGLLGAAPARAADLGPIFGGGSGISGATRAAPIVIYDYQPGVMVRGYFRSPWRNRHYYPRGEQPPVLGRDEVIPGPDREMPEPAESYYRYWSTTIFVEGDAPPPRRDRAAPKERSDNFAEPQPNGLAKP
jgi:hypothetical protein